MAHAAANGAEAVSTRARLRYPIKGVAGFVGDANAEFVECWREASWLQHLRRHERVSEADHELQDEIAKMHRGATPPTAVHLISVILVGEQILSGRPGAQTS